MKKHIYDESNGLSYTLHGDYYLPDLAVNEEELTYGKYGMLLPPTITIFLWLRTVAELK